MNRFFTLLLAASCLTAVGQVPDYVPTDGLLAWYPFNGNANDESGSDLHALPQAVDLVEDRFGTPSSAYHFSGESSSFLSLPDMPSPQEFSLSVWCRKEVDSNLDSWIYGDWQGSAPVFGTGVQYQGGIGLVIRTDNLIYAHIDSDETPGSNVSETNGYSSSSSAIGIGVWEHIVVTRSNGQTSFWLNSELSETVLDYSENPTDRAALARIGASAIDSQKFQGEVDDFGFWSRALSGSEIQGLFSAASAPVGCTDIEACNFFAEAMIDDGSCHFNCQFCHDGTVWDEDLFKCVVANPADINFDGCVQLNDLLDLLQAYGNCAEVAEESWQCGDPLEYQGYDYATVLIGEQCWFAENLRNENYENGDAIPSNLSDSEWSNHLTDPSWNSTIEGASAVYGEDAGCNDLSPDIDACNPAQSLSEYGRLYNWFAVDDARGLCPSGWHVPSDGEWTTMTDFLGGESVAGNKMKTTYGWLASGTNGNGTNSSGFSGLPGGERYYGGQFFNAGGMGYWWSSSHSFGYLSWYRNLNRNTETVHRTDSYKQSGFSVRCVRDAE